VEKWSAWIESFEALLFLFLRRTWAEVAGVMVVRAIGSRKKIAKSSIEHRFAASEAVSQWGQEDRTCETLHRSLEWNMLWCEACCSTGDSCKHRTLRQFPEAASRQSQMPSHKCLAEKG
jgi:hypothetical protein